VTCVLNGGGGKDLRFSSFRFDVWKSVSTDTFSFPPPELTPGSIGLIGYPIELVGIVSAPSNAPQQVYMLGMVYPRLFFLLAIPDLVLRFLRKSLVS
jgi:hypothetical protein